MSEDSIYETSHKRDHIDALHEIAHLAKIGAASTDTVAGVKHMSAAQCSLFEVIHRLANEGVELAEGAGKATA